MYEHSRTEYQAPDGTRYRVRIVHDEDATSPREWDNFTVMHTFDGAYVSPDGRVCDDRYHRQVHPIVPSEYVDGSVDLRRASRYVALFMPEVVAFAGLERGHEGSLSIVPVRPNRRGGLVDGYVAIMADALGDLAETGFYPNDAWLRSAMQQDVDAYNRWAEGSYVGYIVEKAVRYVRTDSIDNEGAYDDEDLLSVWEDVESLWGIDDEDYAAQEAVATLPEGSVQA